MGGIVGGEGGIPFVVLDLLSPAHLAKVQPTLLPSPTYNKSVRKRRRKGGGTMVVVVAAEAAGWKREEEEEEGIDIGKKKGIRRVLSHHKWRSRKKLKKSNRFFFKKIVKYAGIHLNVRILILQRKALGCCVSLARGGKGMLPPPSSFDP